MATKVHMEALSPTMEEGQIVKWLKSEGDAVKSGEVLAEVETDKATMELVARGDGILRKILAREGVTAPVGEVIAVIAKEDEDIGALLGSGNGGPPAEAPAAETEQEKGPAEARRDGAPATSAPSSPSEADGEGGRVKASPLARRLAREAGIPLEGLEGTGPGGRIVKRDIEAAVEEGRTAPAGAAPLAASAPTPVPSIGLPGDDWEDIPLTQIRKTIARRLTESIGPVPHFFLTIDVDMSRAVETRKQVNALLEGTGDKVSFNDLVLKATAVALRKHPECNVHWLGDQIRRHHRVHLAVAVAIDDGLITPVIRDADRKGLAEIGREVKELAGRAREKKLKPEEYSGGTFSVSNLGMFGIEEFTAVINPPEGGILAVGALEDRAVVVDGEVVVRPRMRLTMSCDHRVIDGAQGARFLATLKGLLEEPVRMLV